MSLEGGLATVGSATYAKTRFNDFVLQVDRKFQDIDFEIHSGFSQYDIFSTMGSQIGWRDAQENGEVFSFFGDGYWSLYSCEGVNCTSLETGIMTINWDEPISITVIVKGTECAIYLNKAPVTYADNLKQKSKKNVRLGSSWCKTQERS
jgi:hypothetical protein